MFGFLLLLAFFIGFWGILTFTLWILGIWWPILPDLTVSQSWHLPLLRFLAGYCFHNDTNAFWQTFGVILGLFGLTTIITKFCFEYRSNRITMQLLGTLALTHFLFWVIVRNSTKLSEEGNFSLNSSFFLYSGILFGCLIFEICAIILLFQLYNRWKSHHFSKFPIKQQPTTIIFTCPHCHTEYYSVVKYCSICHKNCDEE